MTLREPIWLLLLVPMAAAFMLWPPATALLRVLRGVVMAMILLALAGLTVLLPSRSGTVVIAVDRSLSIPQGGEQAAKDAIKLVQNAAPSGARTGVISFGRQAVTEQSPSASAFTGFTGVVDNEASEINSALDAALALIPSSSPGRILILTDGQWTGADPAEAAARAAARGIGIDYRMISREPGMDTAIARLDAPGTVEPGEAFMLAAWVSSSVSQEISYVLKRSGVTISTGKTKVSAGLSRLLFRDQAPQSGTCEYLLTIAAPGKDPVPGNNQARTFVGVAGRRSLICVSQSMNSGLAKLLRQAGLDVEVRTPEQLKWRLEDLSAHSAVLLEDVPAKQVGEQGMNNLAAWVREGGNGLMMTGGKNSYAPGGYYKSPLEPVLPISMELKREHRKMSLAIVVAMDRSGSMAMAVGGGRTKIQLAGEGAAQVLDLMSPMDEFGVVAVDSAPHVIVNLMDADAAKGYRNKVLQVESMGGGIFIYEALNTAAQMIQPAKAGTRHIILFADAADSEEPGDYKKLLARLSAAGVTVSVIGLGTPQDVDAKLLEEIARLGGGRIEFTNDPGELPRLFAQETFIVARSTFVDEVTPIEAAGGLVSLVGRTYDEMPKLGGYNLCYLQPDAQLGVITKDEYAAPVVAAWSCGAGRALCYTGEAGGEFTGPIGSWPRIGEFYASLARWTMGGDKALPGGSMLTQRVHEGVCTVELHLDPARQEDPFTGTPAMTILRGTPGMKPEIEHSAMLWTDPDTLAVDVPLSGAQASLATLNIPGWPPVSLPPVCLPYSLEYSPSDASAGSEKLKQIAQATGGQERVDLPDMWRDMPSLPRRIPLAEALLLVAAILLLVEVLERRTRFVSSLNFEVVKPKLEAARAIMAKQPRARKSRERVQAIPKPRVKEAAKAKDAAPETLSPAKAVKPAKAKKSEPPAKTDAGVTSAMRSASQKARHRTERDK